VNSAALPCFRAGGRGQGPGRGLVSARSRAAWSRPARTASQSSLPVDPARVAALAGRELPAILHALPELAITARPPARRYTREDIQRSHAAKREKYAAIRRDATSGMSGRAIERKHHVGRRTIINALASASPPQRKKIHREPAALNDLQGHIDAMIHADPPMAIAAIWQRIADDHGTTVAYPTLRTYVVNQRDRLGL